MGFLFFTTGAFAAGASTFVPLIFAQRACCDAFIRAMVEAERFPVLPSLLAEVDTAEA